MKILVPSLGESVTEATVAKWLKNSGETVSKDEVLVELETDKATLEVYAQSNGVLSEIYIDAGEDVEIGAELAEFLENENIDSNEVIEEVELKSNAKNETKKNIDIGLENEKNNLLVIELFNNRKKVLIPFVKEIVTLIDLKNNFSEDTEQINEFDNGNDFENIINQTSNEIIQILSFLRGLKKVIFSNLTGSGSCCYAAFENKNHAIKAKSEFNKNFPKLWSYIGENNFE